MPVALSGGLVSPSELARVASSFPVFQDSYAAIGSHPSLVAWQHGRIHLHPSAETQSR